MRRLLLLGIVLFVVAGCTSHTNPIKDNPINETYQETITLNNMVVPLPEGEWEVAGRGFFRDRDFFGIFLVNIDETTPQAIIFIKRDSPYYDYVTRYSGYPSSVDLEREDMLHVVSNRNEPGEARDGWFIDHTQLEFSSKIFLESQAHREVFKYFLEHNIQIPANFIKITHLLTGDQIKYRYLQYDILINPEAEGFEPPNDPSWLSSDWNMKNISNDPGKLSFIEKLKGEGEVFHEELQYAFQR